MPLCMSLLTVAPNTKQVKSIHSTTPPSRPSYIHTQTRMHTRAYNDAFVQDMIDSRRIAPNIELVNMVLAAYARDTQVASTSCYSTPQCTRMFECMYMIACT